MKRIIIILVLYSLIYSGCSNRKSSEVIVFHAGSLAVPFSRIVAEYQNINPGISVVTEAAGSLVCARKITELSKPCDIMASADYQIIDEILIPDYTGWNLGFATNEIVIAYNGKSKYGDQVNSNNWIDILLRKDVVFGRSDPDSDPCGYRTLLMLQLAEMFYGKEKLVSEFESKDQLFIRPKEIDLTALLEVGAVDYVFQYKSVAVQHGLDYVELPDEINLGNPLYSDNYRSVTVAVAGSKPGETIEIMGDYIMYGITILDEAPNKVEAERFMAFVAGPRGREILREAGQNPVSPPVISGSGMMPEMILEAIK